MVGLFRRLGLMPAAIACLGIVPFVAASAQSRPIEFGTDVALSLDFSGGENTTTVSIPSTVMRVGFWASDRLSIEPNMALSWTHVAGENVTTFGLGLGALYHFSIDAARARPYFIVIPAINHLNVFGSSATQFSAGGGFGVLLPIQEQLAFRGEGLYSHGFETNTVSGTDEVAVRLGVSFFTK